MTRAESGSENPFLSADSSSIKICACSSVGVQPCGTIVRHSLAASCPADEIGDRRKTTRRLINFLDMDNSAFF